MTARRGSNRRRRTGSQTPALAWCGANRHFVAAALILALSTGGWYFAIEYWDITLLKKPVPWPKDVGPWADVVVDPKTFQNISLPVAFGKNEKDNTPIFVRAQDGELNKNEDGRAILDGVPDGEIMLIDEVRQSLKMGTALDKDRIGERRSNWYVCRAYIDTRKKSNDPFRVWRLNVYYYTGVRDQIPHVGEVCLVAGGATITESSSEEFTVPDCPRSPWNKPLSFRRTRWEAENKSDGKWCQYVQYYIFSMNDEPFNDRLKVRFKLMWPWVKHSYYAKIEFLPARPITDIDEADAAAREFARAFLPHVIAALPTSQTIDELDSAD